MSAMCGSIRRQLGKALVVKVWIRVQSSVFFNWLLLLRENDNGSSGGPSLNNKVGSSFFLPPLSPSRLGDTLEDAAC
jgi:hypothetical protein